MNTKKNKKGWEEEKNCYLKFENERDFPVKNLSFSNFKLQFSFSSAPLVFLFVFTRDARDFTD